ncbi:MAG: endonuclease/exonuclease/phosphatase family protein [Magnetospirillum gryphiswaldense]|nr:endonuclease/exonuclease/phosphatase family protein [Magnetospirillum gryphiswaldense]
MRVVTLNTWKGDGAYADRLAAMARGLEDLSPDVVLLQEVLDAPSLSLHTGHALGRHLGLNVINLPLREKKRVVEGRRVDSRSGLAVLSRHPVRATLSIPLPSAPEDGERAALVVEINAPHGPTTVTNLHLTHLDDPALRRRQLEAAKQVAKRPGTALIGGDFNSHVEDFHLAGSGWRDCRSELGHAPRSTLVGQPDGPCLDHLLWSGHGRPPKSWRVDLDRVCDKGLPVISDHCAVVVELAD